MSTEKEFTRWLERPEKTFTENLQFALKAWQSAEFTLSSKYELVLQWLTQQQTQLGDDVKTLQVTELQLLLQLKCQPGLVAPQVKRDFVLLWIQLSKKWKSHESRSLLELLQQLTEFELLQDLYRADYELYAQLMGSVLRSYELYLQQLKTEDFLPAHESTFFAQLMQTLQTSAKRAANTLLFEQQYTKAVLQPLVQVLLALQQRQVRAFESLRELEQLLCADLSEQAALERIKQQPLHVCLLTLECAIVNQRGAEQFQLQLLRAVFVELLAEQLQEQPALLLTIAAYTLEMFRKHDISLNFMAEQSSASEYLGTKIVAYVEQFKAQNLQPVLQLLCATLRLNPLILERHIFQLTTWMIVAPKRTAAEQQHFEQYLLLLMEMFRKLSRADKFVVNLLKALKQWLQQFELCVAAQPSKGKRKSQGDVISTPQKQPKLTVATNTAVTGDDDTTARYLDIIFHEFHAASVQLQPIAVATASVTVQQSFPTLQTTWPWASVGVAFSKLIVGLMSNPSLVIWTSLIYNLKEQLQTLADTGAAEELSDNSLFQLELVCALLAQYFAGSRLAEQSEKFADDIEKKRALTEETLRTFGELLLARAHSKRTMNAFLECCYYAGHFDLIRWYYRSDRLADATPYEQRAERLHSCLSEEQWQLLQQRVINFGKSSCKYLLNRLLLQRVKARQLFTASTPCNTLQKTLLTPLTQDAPQLLLLLASADGGWLLRQLQRDEMLTLVELLIADSDSLSKNAALLQTCGGAHLDFLELLSLGVYKQLSSCLAACSKKSLLGGIDFTPLLSTVSVDAAMDKRVDVVAAAINAKLAAYKLSQLPAQQLEELFKLLQLLPLAHCRRQTKNLLFALHLALLRDLQAAAQQPELLNSAFELLNKLLHFGQHVQIFKHFPAANMLQLLPVDSAWPFYELLFSRMRSNEKGGEKGAELFLAELLQLLSDAPKPLEASLVRLLLLGIETLSALTGPSAKRLRKSLDGLLQLYASHVHDYFAQTEGRKTKQDKRFVAQLLPGCAAHVKARLSAAESTKTPLDENFRRICKIFIGYSMNYNNPHAIRLITVALNQRQSLHFDQDEVEFVLNGYWQQLQSDLQSQQLHVMHAEAVIKLIIANKTNEDLLLLLKGLGEQLRDAAQFGNVTQLLSMIAKCPFSTIKGAIFNEQFKQLTFDMILRLPKDANFQFVELPQVLALLAAQQAIVENVKVPLSADTLDDILAFLMDINIKKFPLSDTNVPLFKQLHLAMSSVCTALIKQRHVLLMERVPQFVHIFKDLLQAIVCYKCERQKDTALGTEELDDLVEVSLKLESLMHIIATHSLDVKRVAPFVLTFAINLMVANKRPTTLYPKIKTHIENICYDLIGICDHRVGRFILRCSNEAARQVYETLVKDHKKYHKFKGKV